MMIYSAVIEKCKATGLYVGYIPGFAGAHSQADTLEELRENLTEVLEMLLEDTYKLAKESKVYLCQKILKYS